MRSPHPVPTAWRFFLDHRASPFAKLFMLLAVLYVISPIDFVPDIAVVIGWLDDLAVAATATTSLLLAFRRYRQGGAVAPQPQPQQGVVETTGVELP